MDEITVDLDVVGRLKLLAFFKEECDLRKATIVYATHIFDGLESWVTHLAYMENGRFVKGEWGMCDAALTITGCICTFCPRPSCCTSLQRERTSLAVAHIAIFCFGIIVT